MHGSAKQSLYAPLVHLLQVGQFTSEEEPSGNNDQRRSKSRPQERRSRLSVVFQVTQQNPHSLFLIFWLVDYLWTFSFSTIKIIVNIQHGCHWSRMLALSSMSSLSDYLCFNKRLQNLFWQGSIVNMSLCMATKVLKFKFKLKFKF